jgi:hypothetical protein
MSGKAPGRDLQAEQDHAEFTGWLEAQGYNPDPDMVCGGDWRRDAFFAGMQAARDLDAATRAAEVRAGHVRIETPAQATPEPAAATGGKSTAQAAREAFVSGCVKRGITAAQAVTGPAADTADVWGETARAAVAAYIEANGRDPVDAVSVIADVVVPGYAAARAALRDIALGIAGDPSAAADKALVAIREMEARERAGLER